MRRPPIMHGSSGTAALRTRLRADVLKSSKPQCFRADPYGSSHRQAVASEVPELRRRGRWGILQTSPRRLARSGKVGSYHGEGEGRLAARDAAPLGRRIFSGCRNQTRPRGFGESCLGFLPIDAGSKHHRRQSARLSGYASSRGKNETLWSPLLAAGRSTAWMSWCTASSSPA